MLYEVLKTFKGSQDGRFAETFEEGTQVRLSEYLADIAVREGWAKPVSNSASASAQQKETPVPTGENKEVSIDNKAVITTGKRRGGKLSRFIAAVTGD
jgi:hypothetical protein